MMIKRSVLVLLLCVPLAGVHFSREAIDEHRRISFVDKTPQFLPRGETLKWLSLGYRGMLADLLWIKTVLYYGRRVQDEDNPYYVYAQKQGQIEETGTGTDFFAFDTDTVVGIDDRLKKSLLSPESRGLVEYVYPMLDRVTTLDPHFKLPYFFGGIHALMNTGEVDASFRLLEKGYAHNPNEWRFPFYLGWIDWMYRGNTRSAHSFMLKAVALPGCPAYAGALLNGLTGSLSRTEMTRAYLQGLLESTESEEIQKQIREVLAGLH